MRTLFLLMALTAAGHAKTPSFRPQTIDDKIQIGYGVAVADVQGDGKPDVLLADKKQFVWYENPTWKKHVIAENLTEKDHVCLAARDIDGDGKCEIAVGAQWNPSDTVSSGAVFYLIAPEDRTQRWEAVQLPHEPTTHRMRWVKRGAERYDLVVVPLHGRGNKNGAGTGVKVLAYQKPQNPRDEWKTEVISDDLHMTHNLDVISVPAWPDFESLIIAGKEGLTLFTPDKDRLTPVKAVQHAAYPAPLSGAGEVRYASTGNQSQHFAAAIEPMHGSQVTVYDTSSLSARAPVRTVLDDTLADGHALACADVLGLGKDQIIAGWRASSNRLAKVGIKMYLHDGAKWNTHLIDDNTMACEDLTVADLNDDGRPEIIAAGRRTQNVIIYWNETK